MHKISTYSYSTNNLKCIKNLMIIYMKSDMTVYEIWVFLEEHLILLYWNNKSSNQSADQCSPYITFVGGSLERIIAKLIYSMPSFNDLAMLFSKVGYFELYLVEQPEDRVCRIEHLSTNLQDCSTRKKKLLYEPVHEIFNSVVFATSKVSEPLLVA